MPGRFRATLAAVAAVVAGLVAPALHAHAGDLGTLTLDAAHSSVSWHGTGVNPAAGYGPPACLAQAPVNCDVVHLDVELPAGTFGANDGVLVSLRWATDFDQYNLYVTDPNGILLAEGTDVDSNAQAVLLKQPQNGVYTVSVVPFYTTFAQDTTYQASAAVWHDPDAQLAAGTRLLPQLWTMPPSNFHIGDVPPIPSNPTGWRWTPDGTFSNSCYLDETVDYGSTRCLRFDNDIRNVGDGALILRFKWDENIATQCEMEQEITVIDSAPIDRNAGPCIFHPQHLHFHYQNMAWYQLFAVDARGIAGGAPVAKSYKLGFCAIDVDDWAFGGAPSSMRARRYSFPTCNVPNNIPTSNPAVWEYMGISPGWGDIYTWDLPAQYLDVSNVHDGVYELVSRANPDGGLWEARTGLETGITCIRITGNTVTTLQQFASQSNTAPLPRCGAGARASGVKAASVSASSGPLSPQSQNGGSAPAITALPNTSTSLDAGGVTGGLLGVSLCALLCAAPRRRRR